ncbi:sulfatase [Vallitalea guaymasensis]|uniref:sulfatase family protein n=1 Tax=Vallitalea guaymasensis TaxID=1185412 RepID=UPI000DE22294|nr:sulfatase-like hydrolase/transferase [Vallitalea guaymasensis]
MKKTNILLITSDQQHFNTIGAFNPEIKTPNLDRLVKEGTTFKRAYCPNPTCTPTRSSIITGMYPSQHGAWTLGTKLSEDVHTVGEDFNSAGYKTALVGKAHFQPLASTKEFPSVEAYPILQDLDFWRDFNTNYDTWYGFSHCELARNHTDEGHIGQHYALWLEEKGLNNWKDYFRKPTGILDRRAEGKWDIPEKYHYDAWISERTNALMEEYSNADEPFLLWASFFDPHPDYIVPEPYYSMYDPEELTLPTITKGEHDNNPPHFAMTQDDNADFSIYGESGYGIHGMHTHEKDKKTLRKYLSVYYGMVTMMDKYIGKILDKLDELGIADNTIVLFTTDHGHFIGHHGLSAKGPFLYEDMIKVPYIVRYPRKIPANKSNDALQSLVDIAPTLLSFADIGIPRIMTGKDQKDVWLGKKESARDHIICEHHHEPTTIHLKTYVDERYKLTVYYNQTYGELFDLEKDPEEINNLWDNPHYTELKMNLMMKYIWAELGKEPMWMPRIAGA